MKRFSPILLIGACAGLLAASSSRAQPNLQQILKDTAVGAHWIYDDFATGVTEAKATSKPLMVTLRCVP